MPSSSREEAICGHLQHDGPPQGREYSQQGRQRLHGRPVEMGSIPVRTPVSGARTSGRSCLDGFGRPVDPPHDAVGCESRRGGDRARNGAQEHMPVPHMAELVRQHPRKRRAPSLYLCYPWPRWSAAILLSIWTSGKGWRQSCDLDVPRLNLTASVSGALNSVLCCME